MAGGFVNASGAMIPINRYNSSNDFTWGIVYNNTFATESYRNKVCVRTTWPGSLNCSAYVTVQYTKK